MGVLFLFLAIAFLVGGSRWAPAVRSRPWLLLAACVVTASLYTSYRTVR